MDSSRERLSRQAGKQPREFDCGINLQTAQALGLAIPQHVLLQATEIIQ